MKNISVHELAQWLQGDDRSRPMLLDVREPWEYRICRIEGSALVPMRELPAQLDAIEREQPVVCICHHGRRSAHVAMYLAGQGFPDVYNLDGGVDAWARQVDTAMATY